MISELKTIIVKKEIDKSNVQNAIKEQLLIFAFNALNIKVDKQEFVCAQEIKNQVVLLNIKKRPEIMQLKLNNQNIRKEEDRQLLINYFSLKFLKEVLNLKFISIKNLKINIYYKKMKIYINYFLKINRWIIERIQKNVLKINIILVTWITI